METQVLIPQEFSLVLTAPGGKKSREQVATVFSTARILQGTVFYPFQGTVRTDKLEIYSYLDEHDVSNLIIFNHSCQVFFRHLSVKKSTKDEPEGHRNMFYSFRVFFE